MRDLFNRIFNGRGSIRAFLGDGFGLFALFCIGGGLWFIAHGLGF